MSNTRCRMFPGLLPYKKVKPTETVRRRITDVHGSLKATEVRALIEKKEEEEQQKKVRKEELELRKAESKEQFLRCREACVCKAGVCRAMGLQQCSVCKNVQKSQCIKKACKVDGLTPVMVYVAARKDKHSQTGPRLCQIFAVLARFQSSKYQILKNFTKRFRFSQFS